MDEHDSPYTDLVDHNEHDQWAFGTGFSDPLAGVDTTLDTEIDGADLAAYCLMLGDDAPSAAFFGKRASCLAAVSTRNLPSSRD
jgi:ring-1,2-phenylacetyl-CoA epoxidase subunit PaaC